MVGGMYLGDIKGLLWGCSVGSWVIFLSNAYLVDKHINYTLLQQGKDLLPILLVSLSAFVVCSIINNLLQCNIYLKAIIVVFSYLLTYMGISCVCNVRAFAMCLQTLKNYITNK